MITNVQLDHLKSASRLWETRDPNHPTAEVRQANTDLIAGVDAMLAELYLVRGKAVSEAREYDGLVKDHEVVFLAGLRARDVRVPADVMHRIDDAVWPDRSGWDQQ